MKGLSLPLPSMFVALCAAVVMYFGGAGFWLSLAILLVWLATLWLARPEPTVETRSRDDGSVSRQAMIELVEPDRKSVV